MAIRLLPLTFERHLIATERKKLGQFYLFNFYRELSVYKVMELLVHFDLHT
jgi:hypothetical protein